METALNNIAMDWKDFFEKMSIGFAVRKIIFNKKGEAVDMKYLSINSVFAKITGFGKEEIKDLVEKIGKLVILPADEEPVLATVTDKEKLKDQPLFAKAENGDKILIYAKAQKAYIYNPTKNVIVDVVPVSMGNTVIISGVTTENPLKIALINGSKNTGMTTVLENRIKENNIAGLLVVSKTTAKYTDYQKTQILDLAGKWSVQTEQLASLLGGQVATETAEIYPSNADVMVIIGADFK